MITREQVADLREGDVVRITGWYGLTVEGPLSPEGGSLWLGQHLNLRPSEREQMRAWTQRDDATLTVVSRAPRPLYVNHPRTEPMPGDVVRFVSDDYPDESYTNVFLPRTEHDGLPWLSLTHDPGERYSRDDAEAVHLAGWLQHLLVDGDTGQVVPS